MKPNQHSKQGGQPQQITCTCSDFQKHQWCHHMPQGAVKTGWIWDENHLNKLVVPLHPGKPITYVSAVYMFENIYSDRKGSLLKVSYEKLLEPKDNAKIV